LIELVRGKCNPTIDTRVPDAVQRESGAPLIRDRHGLERSTQVGFTRLAHIGRRSRVNPRSESAEKQEKTGIGPTSAVLAAAGERCTLGQTNPSTPRRSSPRKRGPMITGRCSWVPALAMLGRDDGAWVACSTNLRVQEKGAGSALLFRACSLQGTVQPQRAAR
jgi:hypothetical protein